MSSVINDIKSLRREKEELEKSLAIALNCLRFYGNKSNWKAQKVDEFTLSSNVADDQGEKARVTISALVEDYKHQKTISSLRQSYTEEQLKNLGYTLHTANEGVFVVHPIKGGLYEFAGKNLNFAIYADFSTLKYFKDIPEARIILTNYINKVAVTNSEVDKAQ